jgi:hypothetical protein
MTTCPAICVAVADDCPTNCPGNATLCANGSCKEDCTGHDMSPCGCESLPIACPKVIDYYDECFDSFQLYYGNNTACLEEQTSSIPQLSFTEPYFVFGYVWIGAVTVAVVGWCYFNEILFPFHASTSASIKVNPIPTSKRHVETWTQTGYKRTAIGTFIYVLVLLTLAGIQLALFTLVILFYVQVGDITRWQPLFVDVEHVNKAFIMTWMIGLPWTMAFRYIPCGIYSLFLRRCSMKSATHVALTFPAADAKRHIHSRGGVKTDKVRQGDLSSSRVLSPMYLLLSSWFARTRHLVLPGGGGQSIRTARPLLSAEEVRLGRNYCDVC